MAERIKAVGCKPTIHQFESGRSFKEKNMELLLEILFIGTLISGMLYFLFDVKNILWQLAGLVATLAWLIVSGFFIGIGVHWANITFGW